MVLLLKKLLVRLFSMLYQQKEIDEFLKTIPSTQHIVEKLVKFHYNNFLNSEKIVKSLTNNPINNTTSQFTTF